MSSNSDHDKNGTNITDILPEVFRSDISKAVADATFNKFLTKDDTRHVAGYIGEGNPSALVKRQLSEPTPHRQAFQLAPVMYSSVGTEESVLTQKGFLQQLSLIGVDTANVDDWATTERFNWIPPINLDMFVNYSDYFWKPPTGQTPAQYFTIENRCNKVTSKLNAYKSILSRRGQTMDIIAIDYLTNAFVIDGKQDDIFVEGFTFVTKGTNNINLADKTWTVSSSSYDGTLDRTSIIIAPGLALRVEITDVTAPPADAVAQYNGQWMYKYCTKPSSPISQLYTWSGSSWVITPQSSLAVISLIEQQSIYQAEVNCACESDTGGWDGKQWDDNQQGSNLWNEALLANISFNTEAEWITHNTQISTGDLWFDLTTDTLKQRNEANTVWNVIRTSFMETTLATTGQTRWDASVGCTPQEQNQWTSQNRWVHKSELSTFVGARRAQVPILEYSSQTEMNEWTAVTHQWKYRIDPATAFSSTTSKPQRLELEPIKSYVASNVGGVWYLYLGSDTNASPRDINYTDTFTNGFKFRITDRLGVSAVFTAVGSVFRECGLTDPLHTPTNRFVTIVELEETDFPVSELAGTIFETSAIEPTPPLTRIEPIHTSQGHPWKGYHQHWLLDVVNTTMTAAAPQMVNPYIHLSAQSPAEITSLTEGMVYVTDTFQEFVPVIPNITQVNLDYRFHYKPTTPSYFALTGENGLRVYLNGVRQYGTFKELSYSTPGTPDYTIVDNVGLTSNKASTTFNYVYAIRFDKVLSVNDTVRIEVGPAAYDDMGLYSVPVRTVENDASFIIQALSGAQPAYKNLMKYQRNEQTKVTINQYPQFNVYDIVSGDVVKTAPLFSFAELNTQPVDPSTQRRIVATTDGKEYQFEQSLVNASNGEMYAYRTLTDNIPDFWYNPRIPSLKKWDGKAWAHVIISATPTGMAAFVPVVSVEEPTQLRTQHMSVWANPLTLEMKQRDAINGVWNILDVTIADADPTLNTIWKTSATTPHYVPRYVGADGTIYDHAENPDTDNDEGTILQKGDPEGDWEVLSQWRNNPEHNNHQSILYSQLITHLTSIVNNQTRIPGLTNRGIFTLNQKDYDFGVGGTIKEHNDAFDTLISAINVTEMTPLSVLEFAQEQYAANLVTMRDVFNRQIVNALIEFSGYPVATITSKMSALCIDEFLNNDYVSKVYGDTTAYDASTGVGMPNWIATLPMVGLADKHRPHLINDGVTSILMHHDGHRSVVAYTAAEQDRLCRILVKTFNSAVPGSATISATTPSSAILPVYWYKIGGGEHKLYKLKSSLTRDWELVDFVAMLSSLFLTIEERLYAATPFYPLPVFDYATVTSTETQQVAYADRMYNRFMDYVVKKNVRAPLINTAYTLTDPYTWNYANAILATPPTVKPAQPRGCWQALYEFWYGTSYPHLEPWALQGFTEKPLWWDNEYADTTGTRRWKYDHTTKTGMWENIRTGKIPAGYLYPDGVNRSTGDTAADHQSIPTYAYFSVNIADTVITGGYGPDDLLPPYYDITTVAPVHPTVRSLFTVFSTQIIVPGSDFRFGEYGPTEWEWSTSAEHVYDRPIVAFLMTPAKFLHQSFGLKSVTVGGLQVDITTKKVYNHNEALFHGDLYNTNQVYTANGMNQWYVNYNRFKGFDTNVGFRTSWTQWTPRQSYQTAGIVDTTTLQVFNKNFDVTDRDYSVILANSGVIAELWDDAFELSILNIPSAIVQYNNQSQWKFSIDTLSPVSRVIEYYGPQVWPFTVDPATNTLTAFALDIDDVTASVRQFTVRGNQTSFFFPGVPFTVTGSSTNDASYTVEKAVFDTTAGSTRVTTVEPIATSIRDGHIDIPSFAHNWQTGDMVMLNSTTLLPYPFEDQMPYYVIRTGTRTMKLARNPAEASLGVALDITSTGQGDLSIGKVKTSFQAFNGNGHSQELWIHYELNTADIRQLRTPDVIVGMSTLINIIDGYEALQADKGIVYNHSKDFVEYDSETGRPCGWQLEVERFIDWAYNLRQNRLQINDRFEFTTSSTDLNTLRFTSSAPAWAAGTKVSLTTTGTLPTPLFAGVAYYTVPTADPQIFQLTSSAVIGDTSRIVDLTDTGSGIMSVALYSRAQSYPTFELNPSRNNVWISTPQGLLSNVLTGPFADIRTSQTIYDQYGRYVTADKLALYRGDKMSRVSIRSGIANDVQLYPQGIADPNNYLHMGGGHFFVEGYEHIIMFNEYTVGKDLVYDPFLGLFIKRFDLDYFEKAEYTLRPNLGGYYLQGNHFKRNLEGSIQDMRRYYDAFELIEGTDEARHARHLLGYHPDDGNQIYLDLLNVNAKSQFLFYRGMIQTKGSVNSVKAYINSKKFVDAKIDEFWAYKVAEFGDSRPKIHPRIKLFADDSRKSDLRLKFVDSTDVDYAVTADAKKGFETVSFSDGNRWVDFPQQRVDLGSPIFLDASITSMTKFYVTHSMDSGIAPRTGHTGITWLHINHSTTTPTVHQFVWSAGLWVASPSPVQVKVFGYDVYIKTDANDGIRVLRQRVTTPGILTGFTSELMNEIDMANGYTRVNSEVVKFASTTYAFAGAGAIRGNETGNLFIINSTDATVTNLFIPGDRIVIQPSTGTTNAGFFTVVSSTVENISPVGTPAVFATVIRVKEPVAADASLTGSLTQIGADGILIVFTINPSVEKINPARLLDTRSHVKLDTIPLWHPARNMHSQMAAHNIDLMTNVDPASYTTSVMTTSSNPWLSAEKDTTWLDTSSLSYVPYYDDVIYPDVEDRINRWGHRPAWSDVKLYQWVETLTHPDDWSKLAAKQAGNTSIPDSEKVTGTPKQTVFKRTRLSDQAIVTDYAHAVMGIIQLETTNLTYANGTTVYLSATSPSATLPKTVTAGTPYTVSMLDTVSNRFTLTDATGAIIDLSDAPALTIVQPFASNWTRKDLVTERLFAVMQDNFTSTSTGVWEPSLTLTNAAWEDGDVVDVYVNGIRIAQNVMASSLTVSTVGSGYRMIASDIIDVVRPVPVLTDAQRTFDPDVTDDGITLEHWSEAVQYSTTTRTYNGITYTYYYFWVEGVTVSRRPHDRDCLSSYEAARQLATIPTAYMIVQDPHDELWARGYDVPPYDRTGYDDDAYLAYNAKNQFMPSIFYRKAIISKVTGRVAEDNRYVIEFTRDLTLRDNLQANNGQMDVKNKHEQWFMFRREQVGAVPQDLWIKMTEAMMGCRYNDLTLRVPSFEREHYDLLNNTETKYGLGEGQIFVNPAYARATLVNYLQDPAHDFKPVDINHFFEVYPATTDAFWQDPQAVKNMCDYMYNTFDTVHTNGIWFDILSDAMVTKSKYTGLMKTSWLACHGIRILDVNGAFDD